MHFDTSLKKFKSIANSYSNQITFLSNEDFDGTFILILRKQQLSVNPFTVALIWNWPNLALVGLPDFIVCKSIDVLLGDFNIDTFD